MSYPILLYIPGLHDGYFEFFSRHPESDALWIIGDDLATESSSLHTEIRALNPDMVCVMIRSVNDLHFREIRVIDKHNIGDFSPEVIISAKESVSRQIAEKYFPSAKVVYDSFFLRYDSGNVKSVQPSKYDRVSTDAFDMQMMELAFKESTLSSDWWRRVGAVLVKNGEVVAVAYNQTVPSEHMHYLVGNPRDFIEAGTLSQFSDVLHSEKGVLAQLLRAGGISTVGMSLYTSVFPCPDCASFIASSGISKCYFASGHASLVGERVLKSMGVELVYVPFEPRA